MPIYFPVGSEPSALLEETRNRQEDSLRRKAILSKMKGIQNQIEALLQKKIRLEFEIKSQKKKLSKLKQQSKFELKTAVELEGFNYDELTPKQSLLLEDKIGSEEFDILLQLQENIDSTEQLLSQLEASESSEGWRGLR